MSASFSSVNKELDELPLNIYDFTKSFIKKDKTFQKNWKKLFKE